MLILSLWVYLPHVKFAATNGTVSRLPRFPVGQHPLLRAMFVPFHQKFEPSYSYLDGRQLWPPELPPGFLHEQTLRESVQVGSPPSRFNLEVFRLVCDSSKCPANLRFSVSGIVSRLARLHDHFARSNKTNARELLANTRRVAIDFVIPQCITRHATQKETYNLHIGTHSIFYL